MEWKHTNKIARTFFLPKVKELLNLLEKREYKFVEDLSPRLQKHKIPFCLSDTEFGSATVFISKTYGLVFKIFGHCQSLREFSNAKDIYPKLAIPTLLVKAGAFLVRIQPIAKTDEKSIAQCRQIIDKTMNKKKIFGNDCKNHNIGIWNNKCVVFDW